MVVICGWSLAQHLELDEVVVVLDLDEPAVGEVAEAVDAGFAGELHRPDLDARTFKPMLYTAIHQVIH